MWTRGYKAGIVAYGVFGVDEWVIDSHHVDLTMLNAIKAVSTTFGAHLKATNGWQNLRITEHLNPNVSRSDRSHRS